MSTLTLHVKSTNNGWSVHTGTTIASDDAEEKCIDELSIKQEIGHSNTQLIKSSKWNVQNMPHLSNPVKRAEWQTLQQIRKWKTKSPELLLDTDRGRLGYINVHPLDSHLHTPCGLRVLSKHESIQRRLGQVLNHRPTQLPVQLSQYPIMFVTDSRSVHKSNNSLIKLVTNTCGAYGESTWDYEQGPGNLIDRLTRIGMVNKCHYFVGLGKLLDTVKQYLSHSKRVVALVPVWYKKYSRIKKNNQPLISLTTQKNNQKFAKCGGWTFGFLAIYSMYV